MKMKLGVLTFLIFAFVLSYGQKGKPYFPVWTYHQKNVDIYGISIGIGTFRSVDNPAFTNSHGIKIELIGAGFGVPMVGSSPIPETDSLFEVEQKTPFSERVNGLMISATGTGCDCKLNGVALGFIGHVQRDVNGISAAVAMNYANVHNGIQIAMFNESYVMNGLQIGLFNSSSRTKGFQIGLWNVNEKRKFPIVNWNF